MCYLCVGGKWNYLHVGGKWNVLPMCRRKVESSMRMERRRSRPVRSMVTISDRMPLVIV